MILWREAQNGLQISSLDHDESASGATTSGQQIWLENTYDVDVTNCGLFIKQKSGTYSGDFSPKKDIDELLTWGDGITAATFGGIQINMDYDTWVVSSWPIFSDKTPTNGSAFYTGNGDSSSNLVLLETSCGADITSQGVFAAEGTDCSFKLRIEVPLLEDTLGTREFDLTIRYTYTP